MSFNAGKLYKGTLSFKLDGQTLVSNDSIIRFSFLPFPDIRFAGQFSGRFNFNWNAQNRSFATAKGALSGFISSAQPNLSSPSVHVTGHLSSRLFNPNKKIDRLDFLLPNFHYYLGAPVVQRRRRYLGELRLKSAAWEVTLTQYHSASESIRRAARERAYTFAHRGHIKSVGNQTFTLKQSHDFVELLDYFFSFCRGRWTGLFLLRGSLKRRQVAEQWRVAHCSVERTIESWFPNSSSPLRNEPQIAFDGFCALWNNSIHRDAIKRVISWYLEANQLSVGLEASVILIQAALEVLIWHCLVESPGAPETAATLPRETAARLKRLLSHYNIPVDPKVGITQLKKWSKSVSSKPADVAVAFVEIRNAFTHGDFKKRQKTSALSGTAAYEALMLGAWYVEMVLLAMMNFKGQYSSRLVRGKFAAQKMKEVPY